METPVTLPLLPRSSQLLKRSECLSPMFCRKPATSCGLRLPLSPECDKKLCELSWVMRAKWLAKPEACHSNGKILDRCQLRPLWRAFFAITYILHPWHVSFFGVLWCFSLQWSNFFIFQVHVSRTWACSRKQSTTQRWAQVRRSTTKTSAPTMQGENCATVPRKSTKNSLLFPPITLRKAGTNKCCFCMLGLRVVPVRVITHVKVCKPEVIILHWMESLEMLCNSSGSMTSFVLASLLWRHHSNKSY